jgi:S-(hydroxymethyl)glutathione dehydrogenase/alcohol dehydrogenase
VIDTRGVIIRSQPGEVEVADLVFEPPRADEVLVEVHASGICHSDDHSVTGDFPRSTFPFALGHEGAGVVLEAGKDAAARWKPGDHVVFSFLPVCGRCRWCSTGHQQLCDLGAYTLAGSRPGEPNSFRLSCDGEPVAQLAGISTFCERTVVHQDSLVKIPADLPMTSACLLGCGVSTGWGSATHAAGIEAGDVVVVMGCGGIGTGALQGARHAGAGTVIAIDPVELKRQGAGSFGATHAFATLDDAWPLIRDLTNGQGADAVIVAVGLTRTAHIVEALRATRKGGTTVSVGLGGARPDDPPINLFDLTLSQKRLQGALYGMCNPTRDIPLLIGMYRQKALLLDEMVTSTYSLGDVAKGFDDLRRGTNIRGVVTMTS